MDYSVQALCEHTILEEYCDRNRNCNGIRFGVVMVREVDFGSGIVCGTPLPKDDPENWCC